MILVQSRYIMATSSEDNNWLWNYYTLDNNIAKCNNCAVNYKMNIINETNIMRHIKSKHGDEYQNIVSLQGSQEVCESQFDITQNNDIRCNYCPKTYFAINKWRILKKHLRKYHKVEEDTAKALWLHNTGYNFDESNINARQRCNDYNNTIPNEPLLSMNRLSKVHQVDVPLETRPKNLISSSRSLSNSDNDEDTAISSSYQQPTSSFDQRSNVDDINNQIEVFSETRPMGLSIVLISVDCLRKYFISEEVDEKCFICDNNYLLQKTYSSMEGHINKKDSQQNVSSENSQVFYKLSSTIADEQTKGAICDVQTSRCRICRNIFKNCNSFTLRKHLIEVHPLEISSEINPMRDAVDIATTSSFSLSNCSSNLTEIKDLNVDFDHDRAKNIGDDSNLMLPPDEYFIDVT